MARKQPKSDSVQEIEIQFGEKALGMSARARTYFFYVTPTGREVNMKECPHIRVSWMRGGVEEDDGSRVTEMGLMVNQPVTLKMVFLGSSFGNPRQNHVVYLNLDSQAEMFQIEGPGEEFGKFKGRCTINTELSRKTRDQLEEIFSIKMIAAPRVDQKKDVRSLIF